MFDELGSYLKGLSAKEVIGPVFTAFLALCGTIYVAREKSIMAKEQRRIDENKVQRDDAERARMADHTYNIAQTQDITIRFRALMDGYEAHIGDLNKELVATRDENKSLRSEIDQLRQRLLRGDKDAG